MSKPSHVPKIAVGVIVLALLGSGGWYFTRPAEVKPIVEAPLKPTTGAGAGETLLPQPLIVRIDSDPPGASIDLAGSHVGQTPFEAHVDRVKLPVALKLSADGYESAEATLTDMTGPSLSLSLKKKVAVIRPPTGGNTGKNPDIKTTR